MKGVYALRITNTATRLKEIMNEENLKQVDILKKASYFSSKYDTKITKADLSQYVSGKFEPGQAKLFVLASALNVNEAWLMGYDVPRQRNTFLPTPHQEISDEILTAIQILAAQSNYNISYFHKKYQIEYNDCIITLSPNDIKDMINSSIEQIQFVVNSIMNNRFRENIIPIKEDMPQNDTITLNAAHELSNSSDADKKNDEFIMNDENF